MPFYRVLVVAKEYRNYELEADDEDDAMVILLENQGRDVSTYSVLDDTDDPFEIITVEEL